MNIQNTLRALLITTLLTLSACSTFQKNQDADSEAETEEEAASEATPIPGELPADAVVADANSDDEDEELSAEAQKKAKAKLLEKPLPKDKANLKEKITEVERESLGDDKKKTLGLYGDLKACRTKLSSKQYGGSGILSWDEPGDKLSEKWLASNEVQLKEYQAVLLIVRLRRDYLKNELTTCEQELASKKPDTSLSASVEVTEGDSDNDERVQQYVCRFVKKGASLKDFLVQTFSRGLLQIENFDLSQEFLVSSLKDQKGVSKNHGLMFMGWKLSFDKGPLTLNQIIFDEKDAKLNHWTYLDKTKVVGNENCLKKPSGVWNP